MRPWLLAFALTLVTTLAFAAGMSNKWRLQFSGDAESAGHIVLVFTPAQGEPMRATIEIRNGRGENGVAKDVRDGLISQVGAWYQIETDDGEDVLVKRDSGQPNFTITVAENTVQGVRINPDEE
jgi:hypothetical protein